MKVKRIKDFYTLSPEVYNIFMKYIEDNNLNKSKLLETLIKTHLSFSLVCSDLYSDKNVSKIL